MHKEKLGQQEKGIINTSQFIWMLFILITSVTAMQVPGILASIAKRDAWLAVIGGWFLDVLLAIVYAYMGIRFPGQNLVQYSITILGKYFGRIVGLLFMAFFLLVAVFLIRGLGQLLSTAFFPKTPLAVLVISAFIVAGYGARKGIEVIGRFTQLLGPIYVISTLVIGFLVYPAIEIDRLRPQLEHGIGPIFPGSIYILTFYGICIMMGMFIPLCNRPENGFLAKFTAVSMGAAFVGMIVVFSIATFGFVQVKDMYAPGLQLTRMISIGDFIERVEVIWMMTAIGAGIIAATILMWAVALGISQIVGLNTYKPLVYPFTLIAIVFALTTYESNVENMNFIRFTYPLFAAFVEAGLEIFLFIIALIFKIKGDKRC